MEYKERMLLEDQELKNHDDILNELGINVEKVADKLRSIEQRIDSYMSENEGILKDIQLYHIKGDSQNVSALLSKKSFIDNEISDLKKAYSELSKVTYVPESEREEVKSRLNIKEEYLEPLSTELVTPNEDNSSPAKKYSSILSNDRVNIGEIDEPVYLDKFGPESNQIAKIITGDSSMDIFGLTEQELQEHLTNPESEFGKNICDILEEQNWESAAEQMLLDVQNIIDRMDDFTSQFEGIGGELGAAISDCLDQSREDALTLAKYIRDNQLPAMHLVERLKELILERKELMDGAGDGEKNYKQYLEELKELEALESDLSSKYNAQSEITAYITKTDEDGNDVSVPNPRYSYSSLVDLKNKLDITRQRKEVVEGKIETMKERLVEIKLEVMQVYPDINIYNDAIVKYNELVKH